MTNEMNVMIGDPYALGEINGEVVAVTSFTDAGGVTLSGCTELFTIAADGTGDLWRERERFRSSLKAYALKSPERAEEARLERALSDARRIINAESARLQKLFVSNDGDEIMGAAAEIQSRIQSKRAG